MRLPESAVKDASRHYIPTLDGWRAVAILLVIFHHDSLHTFASLHKIGHVITFGVFTYGYVGVDVFFAISGLLICTLLLNEEQKSGRIDLRAFYIRRAFRIIPPALSYLAVLAILGACRSIPVRPVDWWGALLFFRNYTHPAGFLGYYTNHYWSLSLEEHFYLFLPFFIVFCRNRRALILLGLGTGLVAANAVVARLNLFPSLFLPYTDFRLGALLLPSGLAVALHKGDLRRRIARTMRPEVIVLATVVILIWQPVILPFFMPFMVASTVLRHESWVAKLLESSPARFVGKRSYSLYLWQQLFMTAHFGSQTDFPILQHWPLSVVCTFACACISYRWIEQPFMRAGRNVLASKPMALKELAPK